MIDKERLLKFLSSKQSLYEQRKNEINHYNALSVELSSIIYGISLGSFNIENKEKETCRWKYEYKYNDSCCYKTECNEIKYYNLYNTRPEAEKFCTYCGKPIEEVRGE